MDECPAFPADHASRICRQFRLRSLIRSRSRMSSQHLRTGSDTSSAFQRGRLVGDSPARLELSGRSSSEASISIHAPRVRDTAAQASATSASASASSANHGRETENATPSSPGQSMACCQIVSNTRSRTSASIPAKKSRSMARMTGRAPGFHSANPDRPTVSHRPANDPADRGSTSSRPSSRPTASPFSPAGSCAGTSQQTRSIGRGISGSIQLNAWMRPDARHSSTFAARASSDGTRRSPSRISSERSAIEASEWASTSTS